MQVKTWVKFGIIWGLTLFAVIFASAASTTLNHQVSDIKDIVIQNLTPFNSSWPELKTNSAYQLLNFIISFGSLKAVFLLPGLSLFKFWALLLYIFIPLLSVTSAVISIFFVIFNIRYNQAQWKLQRTEVWTTIFLRYGGVLTYVLFFMGLFFIAGFENHSFTTSYYTTWYNISNYDHIFVTNNSALLQASSFNLLGIIINQMGFDILFSGSIPGVFQTGAVLLIFIVPILTVALIISLIVRYSVRSLLAGGRRNYDSQFLNWLGFINISTARELKARLKSNVGMIISGIGFIIFMIFPAFTSAYNFTTGNFVILGIAITLILVSFIPVYIIYYRVAKLQNFSYNWWMFIQMLVWSGVSIVWQLIMWTECQAYFGYPSYVSVLTMLCFSFIFITSFYLLLKGYRQ